MQDSVRRRLQSQAEAINRFRSLHPKEQEWLYPLLAKGFQTTIELLDCINDHPMTFEAIANELGINPQTVSQKLNALRDGGIEIQLTKTMAYAPTRFGGRPRKLVGGSSYD